MKSPIIKNVAGPIRRASDFELPVLPQMVRHKLQNKLFFQFVLH